jgi:hypothetical protein
MMKRFNKWFEHWFERRILKVLLGDHFLTREVDGILADIKDMYNSLNCMVEPWKHAQKRIDLLMQKEGVTEFIEEQHTLLTEKNAALTTENAKLKLLLEQSEKSCDDWREASFAWQERAESSKPVQ